MIPWVSGHDFLNSDGRFGLSTYILASLSSSQQLAKSISSCRSLGMTTPIGSILRALLKELEHQRLDKGNRGELIAMVLCLLAREEIGSSSRSSL